VIGREHHSDGDNPLHSDKLHKKNISSKGIYESIIEHDDSNDEIEVDLSAAAARMTKKERFDNTLALWPWMIPLFVVYFAEYAMQSGVWASIGFPVENDNSRDKFYLYSNWCYQAGVFVSRSSGVVWKPDIKVLW
jgi:hypothetical protein